MRKIFFISFIALIQVLYSCDANDVYRSPNLGGINGASPDQNSDKKNGENKGGDSTGTPEPAPPQRLLTDPCPDTLFPLMKTNCAACHNGKISKDFKLDNEKEACDYLIGDGNKVNLRFPDLSVLVTKMKSGHNCWADDNEVCVSEMTSAIESWATQVTDILPEDTRKLTPELSFLDATDAEQVVSSGTEAVLEVEDLNPQGFNIVDDANASKGKVITSENAPGMCANQYNDGLSRASGVLTVPATGTYYYCARARSPDGGANSFHFSFGLGARPSEVPISDELQQFRINASNSLGDPIEGVDYVAGDTVSFYFACRERNAVIDQVAISQDPDCNYNVTAGRTKKELTYDLTESCGTDAKLKFYIEDATEKSVNFSCPRIVSTSRIKLKTLNIFVNSKEDPSYTTFRNVDSEVAPGDESCLSQGFMSVTKVNEPTAEGAPTDKWSFAADVCEAVQ